MIEFGKRKGFIWNSWQTTSDQTGHAQRMIRFRSFDQRKTGKTLCETWHWIIRQLALVALFLGYFNIYEIQFNRYICFLTSTLLTKLVMPLSWNVAYISCFCLKKTLRRLNMLLSISTSYAQITQFYYACWIIFLSQLQYCKLGTSE